MVGVGFQPAQIPVFVLALVGETAGDAVFKGIERSSFCFFTFFGQRCRKFPPGLRSRPVMRPASQPSKLPDAPAEFSGPECFWLSSVVELRLQLSLLLRISDGRSSRFSNFGCSILSSLLLARQSAPAFRIHRRGDQELIPLHFRQLLVLGGGAQIDVRFALQLQPWNLPCRVSVDAIVIGAVVVTTDRVVVGDVGHIHRAVDVGNVFR